MKYIVSAMSIVNNILYADGRKINEVTGGGLFMLGGVMSLDPSVAFVTAAGDDFEKFHGKYFRAHRLGYEGIHRTLPYTHYTDLIYSTDGSWTERSIYGDTYMEEHAQDTMVHASWIAELAGDDTAAVYTESGAEEIFWNDEELGTLRKAAPNALLCWEIPYYNTFSDEQRPLIYPLLEKVDMFSLNLKEARTLFGCEDIRDIISKVRDIGKTCFLRMGIKGSSVIMPERPAVFVPSIGLEITYDATGCGNTSTAAAMTAVSKGYAPQLVCAYANAAADFNARQLGPYPEMTDNIRDIIRMEAESLALEAEIINE